MESIDLFLLHHKVVPQFVNISAHLLLVTTSLFAVAGTCCCCVRKKYPVALVGSSSCGVKNSKTALPASTAAAAKDERIMINRKPKHVGSTWNNVGMCSSSNQEASVSASSAKKKSISSEVKVNCSSFRSPNVPDGSGDNGTITRVQPYNFNSVQISHNYNNNNIKRTMGHSLMTDDNTHRKQRIEETDNRSVHNGRKDRNPSDAYGNCMITTTADGMRQRRIRQRCSATSNSSRQIRPLPTPNFYRQIKLSLRSREGSVNSSTTGGGGFRRSSIYQLAGSCLTYQSSTSMQQQTRDESHEYHTTEELMGAGDIRDAGAEALDGDGEEKLLMDTLSDRIEESAYGSFKNQQRSITRTTGSSSVIGGANPVSSSGDNPRKAAAAVGKCRYRRLAHNKEVMITRNNATTSITDHQKTNGAAVEFPSNNDSISEQSRQQQQQEYHQLVHKKNVNNNNNYINIGDISISTSPTTQNYNLPVPAGGLWEDRDNNKRMLCTSKLSSSGYNTLMMNESPPLMHSTHKSCSPPSPLFEQEEQEREDQTGRGRCSRRQHIVLFRHNDLSKLTLENLNDQTGPVPVPAQQPGKTSVY